MFSNVSWLLLALFGTVSFTLAGLLDKLILDRYLQEPKVYLLCQVLAQQVFSLTAFAFIRPEFVFPDALLAMGIGSIQVLPTVYFLRAIKEDELSRVTSLEYFYIVLVLFLSASLLDESLPARNYAGAALILLSSIIVAYRPDSLTTPALRHLLPYWVMNAIYYIAMKYLLCSMGEWDMYIWSSFGNLIAVVPFLRSGGISGLCMMASSAHTICSILVEEAFQFLGMILFIFAYASGPLALVNGVGALQPMMTFISILVIRSAYAGLIEEDTCRGAVMRKLSAVSMVALGIYFIC
ncbi:hypothetical protein Mthe_0814 [Methanothrix thermoacetophila PT]|jgi:uncharacterized membrane protein|uniref:EamA domain-containing protein n=1 Tax=Methanothrix thermoacetophila (strain DSM 6194 / JCM 14653 / NBRC 101360 / PT) TaxID=349307 RepID=A0B7C9_METTP|nr:hypothetical protein Mthe_0814 [Methanothrix thermoacetophila PT]